MKFDLMSDLHVDLSPSYKLDYSSMATSSVAVVAGDISNDPDTTILELDRIATAYDRVLFVDGNHEHYDNHDETRRRPDRMPEWVYAYLWDAFKGHPKVTYLGSGITPVVIDRTAFVGANSWYDFNWGFIKRETCIENWYGKMNDSKWANIDHEWVMNECQYQTQNIINTVDLLNDIPEVDDIVIVTHTIPIESGVYYHPTNMTWNALNGCYLNSMMRAAHKGKVRAHCFGHTHKKQLFTVDGIDFVCNPRGYQGEPGFTNWEPFQVDLGSFKGSAFGEIE